MTPPTASATTFTFDDFNNKTSAAEPSPKGTTNFTFDYWNRLKQTTFPDGSYTLNTYDDEGNITDVRMEDGSHRTTTYDGLNQPLTTTVPVDGNSSNNLVTVDHYDFNERKDYVVAADGLRTNFYYNERGDLIMTSYSDGTNRQWGYNGVGDVLWRQNGRGNLTYYTYDYLSRLKTINYQTASTPNVSYAYRMDGLRTSRTDVMGTSTWNYNTAKQMTGLYDAATNQNMSFTYQAGTGRPTSTVAPGNTWNYYYDSNTRPLYTTQTLSGEIVRNAIFNNDGSVQRKTYVSPNTKTEYGYDTRGRITSIRHAVTSIDATQEQLNYQYTNGNVSQYTLSINGGPSYTTNYTHDFANRLTSEVRTSSNGLNGFNNSYAYTKGDDRYSTTRNGSTSTYSYYTGTNRLLSGEGYTVNSYDNDGNPTSISVPGQGTWTMTYDEDSRLVSIAKSNGTTTFKYNGEGLRVERATPSSTYRYLLHGQDVVLTTTTSYNIQAYYTPGVGYFQGGQMYFYQENALGSALVVRDSAGNWISLTEYDAYGGEYDIQGTGKSDFRFAGAHGYIKDDETGMELLGRRFYLPILGRFLNQDPIGSSGGLNLYSYCSNSPLSKLDPKGEQGVNMDSVRASISEAMRKASSNPAQAVKDLQELAKLSGLTAKTVELIERRIEQCERLETLEHTHHYLPQQFAKFFSSKGLDIEEYCMSINAEIHRICHGKFVQGFSFPGMESGARFSWNQEWATWITDNPNASPQQIVNFANNLATKTGLPTILFKGLK